MSMAETEYIKEFNNNNGKFLVALDNNTEWFRLFAALEEYHPQCYRNINESAKKRLYIVILPDDSYILLTINNDGLFLLNHGEDYRTELANWDEDLTDLIKYNLSFIADIFKHYWR